MKNVITSRIELLLAKIAGRDVDISTMTPPVAINLKEELLMDIADRLDSAASELPEVSATDNGDVLKVVSGKWAKGEESKELPAVSSTDNGNVLAVVEGAWAKSAPSGGGGDVIVVNFSYENSAYVADKTFTEVYTALMGGKSVVAKELVDSGGEASFIASQYNSEYVQFKSNVVVPQLNNQALLVNTTITYNSDGTIEWGQTSYSLTASS